VKELQQVGVDVPPSVCCSIDDLRIYRDAFTSPALLLAYPHLRNEAEHCADAHVNDELEHLGLFLAHGDYIQEIRRQTRDLGSPIRAWAGFVKQIDKHFQTMGDQEASEISWPYSPMVVQVAQAILRCGYRGRTADMLSLLRSPEKERTRLVSRTEKTLAMAEASSGPVCVATGMSIGDKPVICVAGTGTGENGRIAAVRAVWAFLSRHGGQVGWALAVAQEQGCPSAEWIDVSQDCLPEDELALVERVTIEMRQTVREWRGLPKMRNKPCPCGSGRKFKKC
jgi:hypothetical protein